jgi:hypothetical protein
MYTNGGTDLGGFLIREGAAKSKGSEGLENHVRIVDLEREKKQMANEGCEQLCLRTLHTNSAYARCYARGLGAGESREVVGIYWVLGKEERAERARAGGWGGRT